MALIAIECQSSRLILLYNYYMDRSYWLQQTKGKLLYPDMEWSRPENRMTAGKLLVVGGNLHGFAAPAEAYGEANKAGVGTVRVLLPASIQKIVGQVLADGEYAPSTPSGSFSQKALNDMLSLGAWADAVLIAGDLGRNSETAILLEKFLAKSPSIVTLSKDSVDYAVATPSSVLERAAPTMLVLSLSQLQRLAIAAKFPKAVTFSMGILHLAEWLHSFTSQHPPLIIVKHHDQLLVAVHGQVSSTKLSKEMPVWRVRAAAHASVWWLQNPAKPYEAITTAIGLL